jgi:hypothetical protein
MIYSPGKHRWLFFPNSSPTSIPGGIVKVNSRGIALIYREIDRCEWFFSQVGNRAGQGRKAKGMQLQESAKQNGQSKWYD